MNSNKTILIYCEVSGAFADLYREAGYNVIVRDIQIDPSHDISLQKHLKGGIHGFLCFPPCTDLSGSGARWWASKGTERLRRALALVDACMRVVAIHKPKFWVLENPVGRLVHYIGPSKVTFQPCEYGGYLNPPGDQYNKRTCLWGEFEMPPKKKVAPIEGSKMHRLPPGPERARLRSETPRGFAKAFFEHNR